MIRGRRIPLRVLLLLAAVLLVAAPQLLSRPASCAWILDRVLPLDAEISVGAARLGWLSPVHLENVKIADREGRPAVAVGTLDGDRPLWRVALRPSTPGSFRLAKVQFDAVVEPQGTNLARLIALDRLRPATLSVELVDAALVIHKPNVPAWQVGPFRVVADLKAAGPPATRQLLIRPGRVLDQAAMTSPKSGELLQYALPLLAEANVSGRLSLELDRWQIPLATPEKASGSGRLVIHRLDVEPGPLLRRLGEALGRPPAISLSQGAAVPFSMSGGRIEHRDLKFTLPNLTLTSHGSVGLDQTLALLVDVELPRTVPKGLPLFNAAGRLSLPIGGTLHHPEVDRAALRASGKDLLRDALNGLLRRAPQPTK